MLNGTLLFVFQTERQRERERQKEREREERELTSRITIIASDIVDSGK